MAGGHGVAWSPDGRRLAFLSDADKPGQLELYTVSAGGGTPKKLTELTGFLAEPRWSPDGSTIAVLFTENAPRAAGPLEPVPPETGVIGERKSTISASRWSICGSGAVRQVSPADLVRLRVRLVARREDVRRDGGARPRRQQLVHRQAVHHRRRPAGKMSVHPEAAAADRRCRAGRRTAAHRLHRRLDERRGRDGRGRFRRPGALAASRAIVTPGMQASASVDRWLDAGPHCCLPRTWTGKPASPSWTRRAAGSRRCGGAEPVHARGWPASLGGARREDLRRDPPLVREAARGVGRAASGAWRQVTHVNADVRPMWGEAKSMHWTSDGLQVQGWLLYPRITIRRARYPLVVVVHGGPAGAWRARTGRAPGSKRRARRRGLLRAAARIRAAASAAARTSRGPTSRISATAIFATSWPAWTRW